MDKRPQATDLTTLEGLKTGLYGRSPIFCARRCHCQRIGNNGRNAHFQLDER